MLYTMDAASQYDMMDFNVDFERMLGFSAGSTDAGMDNTSLVSASTEPPSSTPSVSMQEQRTKSQSHFSCQCAHIQCT